MDQGRFVPSCYEPCCYLPCSPILKRYCYNFINYKTLVHHEFVYNVYVIPIDSMIPRNLCPYRLALELPTSR